MHLVSDRISFRCELTIMHNKTAAIVALLPLTRHQLIINNSYFPYFRLAFSSRTTQIYSSHFLHMLPAHVGLSFPTTQISDGAE